MDTVTTTYHSMVNNGLLVELVPSALARVWVALEVRDSGPAPGAEFFVKLAAGANFPGGGVGFDVLEEQMNPGVGQGFITDLILDEVDLAYPVVQVMTDIRNGDYPVDYTWHAWVTYL